MQVALEDTDGPLTKTVLASEFTNPAQEIKPRPQVTVVRLTSAQLHRLATSLIDAFPERNSLSMMLRYRLDGNLSSIDQSSILRNSVFNLIQAAVEQAWIDQFIVAACEAHPENPMLYEIASELGFVGTSTTGETLTRLIAASNSRLDISSWIARLGRIETQVCRVEIEEFGVHHDTTGFLVGPDLLMTTYHSFQMVIAGNASPRSVRFRFDYKASPDGTTINTGTVYSLAESDWLIDYSPSGVSDLLCRWDEPPLPNLLDYVLVRLAGSPGKEPVGAERAEYDAMPRGWIEIPSHPAKFQTGTALFVVHHSSGSPLKVSLDTDAVIGLNENGTRVWYKVNEMAGSSGAPCFDSNWKLVAMHHASVHGMVGKEDERRVIHTTTYTCLIEFTKSEGDPTKGTHV